MQVDGDSGGSILIEENLMEKSGKVIVDGDRVVEIVEKDKSSVKSVKLIIGLNCQKALRILNDKANNQAQ